MLLAVTVIACSFVLCSGLAGKIIECAGYLIAATTCIVKLIANGGRAVGHYCDDCGPALALYFRAGCPAIDDYGENEVNAGV